MNPIVSIIIPVYNRLNYLPDTFESVFNQTYNQWEIVAVDDGSTDGSFDWLINEANLDKRISVVKNDSGKKGPSAARNLGLKYAKGEYVVFLDSDDLLETFCLMQRVIAMQTHPNLSYSVFPQKIFNNSPKNIDKLFCPSLKTDSDFLNMFLRNENPWQTMAVLWKRTALIKLGGFDEEYLVMEDPELHSRVLLIPKLEFMFFSEYPSDSLYRINNMDPEKSSTFYRDSILYRFAYYRKIFQLIQMSDLPESTKLIANENLVKGIWKIFAYFLLARVSDYLIETCSFLDWAKSNNVLSRVQLLKANLLINIWSSNSFIIRITRIRGLIYMLLFKKVRLAS